MQPKARLDNQCPIDISTMPKLNGNYFCSNCQKSVHDFTKQNDFQVIQQVSKFKTTECIKIEKKRFNLVNGNIPKWKFFLVLILNVKGYFLQKLSAQNSDIQPSSSPQTKAKWYGITGVVKDSKTKKLVNYPIIEIYRDSTLLQKVQGDKKGYFNFSINLETFKSISMRIYSSSYVGSYIKGLPIVKMNSILEIHIRKKGQANELHKISEPESVYYGMRFLD